MTLYGAEGAKAPLEAIPFVDLFRYVGKWHEIARIPNSSQRKCASNVTATFSLRPDGAFRVVNECRAADGKLITTQATAKRADRAGLNSKLRITSSWLSSEDYWIIGLDPDYQWSLVGEPKRERLWILSREPKMPDDLYDGIVVLAGKKGFDVSRIEKTPQGQ